jgi:hypothetical protein
MTHHILQHDDTSPDSLFVDTLERERAPEHRHLSLRLTLEELILRPLFLQSRPHCHMPDVEAPTVAGGPPRHRRSHRFAADKDLGMLLSALNASVEVEDNRTASVRITNDRVGHAFPGSGMNELIIDLTARGRNGSMARTRATFGTRELIPGYLDFWHSGA